MSKLQRLLDKAQSLPQEAGCYLMRDKNGRVIYVGKAKKLKNRVISYFNNSAKGLKTEYMVSHIDEFDFIITRSDAESYILENNLIKEHAPKYNIRLRDDKSYPYIQVNHNQEFPRIEYVRRPKKARGIELLGPYPTGFNISPVLRILTKAFALRDCSLNEFKSRKTPCLIFQMKQCSAPCVGLITKEQYSKDLSTATGYFHGPIKARKAILYLENKMKSFSEREEFEMAAIIRDDIAVLEEFSSKAFDQKVETLNIDNDMDVWSYYSGETEIDISVYTIRSGSLLGQKNFHFIKGELLEEIENEVLSKIVQYYSDLNELSPENVVIDSTSEDLETVSEALTSFGVKKTIGPRKSNLPLIQMCRKHAQESQRVRTENKDSVYLGLNKLKELLSLKERPRILECYDIAIWQGMSPTAARITFEDGKADKARYRYYHLEIRPEGNNDFAMMREVILRRMNDEEPPDVLVIDGGVAQVNTVVAALKELGLSVPVVGIAKSRDLTSGNLKSLEVDRTDERLIIPGRANPYVLTKCPALFKIIVSMRDEAHRFSRKLHHKAESKRVIQSWVHEVKGLGKEGKNKILSNLSMSIAELTELSEIELVKLFQLSNSQAKHLWRFLHKGS